MNKKEREMRIVRKGEHSDHCHILVGDCIIEQKGDEMYVTKTGELKLVHARTSLWVESGKVEAAEHFEIVLPEPVGTVYKFNGQLEYDPYADKIEEARD